MAHSKNLAGDSGEQRETEHLLVKQLSFELRLDLSQPLPQEFRVALDGTKAIPDGFCLTPLIFCEAWAHIGSAKSAQKNKVLADVLKLIFFERLARRKARKILIFADAKARKHLMNESWAARALKEFEIETRVVGVSPEMQEKITAAQKRQYR